MRLRTVLLLVVIAVIAAVLFINWQALSAPVKLNLLLTVVELPMGMVMLGLLGLASTAFATYVGLWQGTVMLDYRRQAKDLQAQRALADSAEESRFTAISSLLREEIAQLTARMESSLEILRGELRDTESAIAAQLGELDDRLARLHAGPAAAGTRVQAQP